MLEEGAAESAAPRPTPGPLGRIQQRPWIVLATAVVASIVLLTLLWPSNPTSPPRLPTYQEILDRGEDPLGWDVPNAFPSIRFDETLEIEDEIFSIEYSDPFGWNTTTLWFPYHGGKWSLYNRAERAPGSVRGDIGELAPGDRVHLLGSKERDSFYPAFEFLVWRLAGAHWVGPPEVSMVNTTIPDAQHAVGIASVSRHVATVHFRFVLFREGYGIDVVRLDTGPRGAYMDFKDFGEGGFLDAGDYVRMHSLAAGNYTIIAEYGRKVEVDRLDFSIP